MESCNVNVRVLYDFEYKTKYGRNVKINSGERLLLIKRTNVDWWQVIRSTDQRPFFVPAAYVEEIQSVPPVAPRRSLEQDAGPPVAARRTYKQLPQMCDMSAKKETSYNSRDIVEITGSFHTAIKSQGQLDTKCYSILPTDKHAIVNTLKKEIYSSKSKLISSTMSSSGYNSLGEEIPVLEEEEEVNCTLGDISKQTDVSPEVKDCMSSIICNQGLDNKPNDAIVDQLVADSGLSSPRDNSKAPSCETVDDTLLKGNDVQHICLGSANLNSPEVRKNIVVPSLPVSDSLENLSLQIELKTNSLRKIADSKSKSNIVSLERAYCYSKLDDEITEIKNDTIYNSNDLSDKVIKYVNVGKPYHNLVLSEDFHSNVKSSLSNNNLQYQGSFKSDTERQHWINKISNKKRLRNFYSCSEESSLDQDSTSLNNEQSRNAVSSSDVLKIQPPLHLVKYNKEIKPSARIDEALQQSDYHGKVGKKPFGSDSQLMHLKAAKENTFSRHSLDSVVEGHDQGSSIKDFEHRKYSGGSSRSFVVTHKNSSDKSSIDSLLDIDNDGDLSKTCGGTTSDSLVPTDGEDLISSESDTDSVKLVKSKQECRTVNNNPRKIPLTRRRRIISSRPRPELLEPPTPELNQVPAKSLQEGWDEYNTSDGRIYFYNHETKEKRWKPPRRSNQPNVDTGDEEDPEDSADMFVVNLSLPSGWKSDVDLVSGHTCYVHLASGDKWFSSTDNEGRVYFFKENSTTSRWTLPENDTDICFENKKLQQVEVPQDLWKPQSDPQTVRLEEKKEESSSPKNLWPQLWDGALCVIKEGHLHKTKITDNGKRVRKNWTSSHAVLTELLLLFFKDSKGFVSMMNGNGKPELSVDLNGTVIASEEKMSSRKHVYRLSTLLGLQVLIQFDNLSSAEQWYTAITAAIHSLPSGSGKGTRCQAESPVEEPKLIAPVISRSRSFKLKSKNVSTEDLSINYAERQTKIKERLKKFFHRRPTVEVLVKKGIWKDEPVFGCQLELVCPHDCPRVPVFVQQCVRCIESSQENMKTDGLYRASGNLSQVQKIRLQVDQNIYSLLEEEEDVHVLAGTLKLFFRELKQPVIPFKSLDRAIRASINPNRSSRVREFRELVKSLPPCNHDTLKFLLQHLLRVSQYQEHNRMHIANIAIVFGPTLMWPQQQSLDMAFDLMQQNQVIECLLTDFHSIFT